MQLWRYIWLMVLGCALAVCAWACAGGSGSSGFDAFPSSENAAIEQALNEQRCVERQGLTICPAGERSAVRPASPTPTPAATPSRVVDIPVPQPTPTAEAIATSSPTATWTPTPGQQPPRKPRVDTGVDATTSLSCTLSAADESCRFLIPFSPKGFAAGTVFRVAVRTVEPEGAWAVGPALSMTGSPSAPVFDAPVAVAAPAPLGRLSVQLAVLAFPEAPASVPAEVDELARTGAAFAFVTPELPLEPLAGP